MGSEVRGPELAHRTLSRSYHATSRTQCVKLVELYKTTPTGNRLGAGIPIMVKIPNFIFNLEAGA